MKGSFFNYILLLSVLVLISNQKVLSQADQSCEGLVKASPSAQEVLAEAFYNAYPALGDQYYLNWTTGIIFYEDGRVIPDQMLRYHGYSDNIHWQRQSDKQVGSIPKKAIEKVVIEPKGEDQLVFRKVDLRLPLSFETREVFLQVLNPGEIELCCFRKTKYIKNSEKGFYPDHQYYLKKGDNYEVIKLSKSGLLSHFSDEEKVQIKQIIKENKLKLSREADMVMAITLINVRL